MDRLLLSGVSLDLRFIPSSDEYALICAKDGREYTFEICDAVLFIAHVRVNPALFLALEESLKTQQAIYPFSHSSICTYNIAQGLYEFQTEDLFQSNLPS